MNSELQEFARQSLVNGLNQLPPEWVEKFKLMYGRDNGKRDVPSTLSLSIEEVVSKMDESKLDWAMTQVKNSINKLKNEK